MTTELQFLIYSVLLGLAHLIAASHFISYQYGYRWTAGNREEEMLPLKGMAGRIDRATTNFLESFPFFAAVVVAAHLAGCHNALTIWGRTFTFGDAFSTLEHRWLVFRWFAPSAGTSPPRAFSFLSSPCFCSLGKQ